MINSFMELNSYLEKAEGKLRNRPEKEAATRKKIQHIMRENLGVVNGSDFNEVGRFLHSVKQIAVLGEGEGMIKMAIDAVAKASSSLELSEIERFKQIDEVLYYKCLAIYISNGKWPVKIKEEDILKALPWVTRLHLSGNAVAQFLGKLSENAPSLKTLVISEFAGDGSVFESLDSLKNLNKLVISRCNYFNQSLNGLTNLRNLKFSSCYAFNQSIDELQGLEKLEIEYCSNFNQSLNGLTNLRKLEVNQSPSFNQSIDGLANLESVRIEGCSTFNQILNGLTNLRGLVIASCRAFNQSLNGLTNLRELEISTCSAFNQSLNELPNLTKLDIKACRAFNQSLNGLSKLKVLDIWNCPGFNQSLNGLSKLKVLEIIGCSAFNQSLKGLSKLKVLQIFECSAFNQSLNELTNLKELMIADCRSFNQAIEGLPNLESLRIQACLVFNKNLGGLTNLKELVISDCPAFKIQDLRTLYILSLLIPKGLEEMLLQMTRAEYEDLVEGLLLIIEEKANACQTITTEMKEYLSLMYWLKIPEEKLEQLHERTPQFTPLLKLYQLDHLVRDGANVEEVREGFAFFKEKENYLDFLKITIQEFPELTSFLLRNLKEEIIPDLKGLNILEQLSLESKMALLPLFSADEIRVLISEVPEETRAKWLEEELEWQEFSGSVQDVLSRIAGENIERADQAARDNLLVALKGLIAKISFKTLAVMAAVSPEIMLAYTFVMEDTQLASVIPSLLEEAFCQHLSKQPITTHREYLLYASTRQKEVYIANDLLKEPESLTDWDQSMVYIKDLMNLFVNEKTKDQFQALEVDWREIVNKTNLTAQTYRQAGQAVQSILLKFSPDKEYENKVISYLEPKMKRAEQILNSLKTTGEKIQTLEKQVVGQVEIPDEFVDSITTNLMTNPYHHPSAPRYIYDLSTWEMLPSHPATRAPVNLEELVPDTELKEKIEAFRKEHAGQLNLHSTLDDM